jgi:hypothetical protein
MNDRTRLQEGIFEVSRDTTFLSSLSQLAHPTAIGFIVIPVLELLEYPAAAQRVGYAKRR